MATITPLSHPQESKQCAHFYPYTVEVKDVGGNLLQGPLQCAYDAATGGEPGVFEDEAPAEDKILIPSWQPDIAAKSQAILKLGTFRKRFEITDVVPQGAPPTKTLLIVSPQ